MKIFINFELLMSALSILISNKLVIVVFTKNKEIQNVSLPIILFLIMSFR